MIDEYQDFSYLFDNFLGTIKKLCPDATIFAVGDDWQAINAFAGSDVKYFNGFLDRYDDARRYNITTNYRSLVEIVEASNRLMECFDSSYPVKSARNKGANMQLGYVQDLQMFPYEQKVANNDVRIAAYLRLAQSFLDEGKTVAFLSRTNKEIENLEDYLRSFFPREKRDLISVSTTHKYKGKQREAVVVIDAEIGKYPLINPSWIFNRIFGDTINKIIDDERRLFYVAITRAKDDLILLTTRNEESPFFDDMPRIPELSWNKYPPLRKNGSDSSSHVKVIISNRPGYKYYPTANIKGLLKAAGYKYNGDGTWYKYYPQIKDILSVLLCEPWAISADNIIIEIIDTDGKSLGKHTIVKT